MVSAFCQLRAPARLATPPPPSRDRMIVSCTHRIAVSARTRPEEYRGCWSRASPRPAVGLDRLGSMDPGRNERKGLLRSRKLAGPVGSGTVQSWLWLVLFVLAASFGSSFLSQLTHARPHAPPPARRRKTSCQVTQPRRTETNLKDPFLAPIHSRVQRDCLHELINPLLIMVGSGLRVFSSPSSPFVMGSETD
jgi:hypothetical protein